MNQQGDLIRLLDMDSEFIIDLRYATSNNFTKQKVYNSGECYINKSTAALLIKAKNIAKEKGYLMKVWDAYRPISAQERFWEILPDNNFVAYPPDMKVLTVFKPSHMNGLCVDITLTDLNGNDIPMPSEFDDFSEKASLSCPTLREEERNNAVYLKSVMESVGFKPYSGEWWHFYDMVTPPCPYLDFKF